tara:strand:- start:243 stop:983 length:741 start_codon:yes stop_codon:yes gene_type:complete
MKRPTRLLGKGDKNTKMRKSRRAFETFGLALAPHTMGGFNVCPHAGGCRQSCLFDTGNASVFPNINAARINRKKLYFEDRDWFLSRLNREIANKVKSAGKRRKRVAVRLNMYSDITWEKISPQLFDHRAQFYDYTKNPKRWGNVLPNYWVTFSRDERNEHHATRILDSGGNAAVVFYNEGRGYVGNRSKFQTLPDTWNGFPVIDGDRTDLRFEDPRGVVVGLRLKAATTANRQQAIDSGFAVPSFI